MQVTDGCTPFLIYFFSMSYNQKPDNFLVWAILTTVMCCLPTGIVALIYANKVDPAWNAGNYQEAEEAAKNARMWTFISLGLGAVSYFFIFFFSCASVMLGS